MPLALGSKLGPYEVREMIGKGGMGEVYRAHDPRLRRDVAIKMSTERFDERFEREARAIAALSHPNICQIYDIGPDYLVMELVEGPTLQERVRAGALPLGEALRIADQIAEALAAAHGKYITHRDLKPGNIKIREDGVVKVLDFGLAKVGRLQAPNSAHEDSPTQSMSLTQEGMILGTAAYMSPEQARGTSVDSRADIWAFGVVLFEMLTARSLFKGQDITDTLASIVKDVPNLDAAPRKVRRLLQACLQKDPTQRLQAIGDRHLLLDAPEVPHTRWWWPALTGALAIAAGALAWKSFHQTPPAAASLRYQLTRSGDSGLTQFQISPDGRHLAYVASYTLHVRALDSLDERAFPGTDGAAYPFWSPDSAHIGFFSQGKLKQVALGGGPATFLADAPDPRGGAWGSDNTIIFTPTVTGTIFRISASGGPAIALKLARSGEGTRDSARFATFLQDSDRFLYTIETDRREGEGVYVGSLSGAPPIRVLPDFSTARFVPTSGSKRSGHILFRRETTLMAQPFDAANLRTTGDAFPLAEELLSSGNSGFADFTVSDDGTLIYAAGDSSHQEREVVWLDRGGARGKTILKAKGIEDFELSPDRTQLAYSRATQVGPGDVWLLDVARGSSQRFTSAPFSAFSAVWSPSGADAVFTLFPEDRLYRKATASAKEEPLGIRGINTYATSWSADGKLIAFSQTGATSKDDLWLLPLEGERKPTLFKQTPYSENSAHISPDGRWMAYTSDASGRREVYIEPIEAGGTPRQVSVAGGADPRWRDDGRELYFLVGNDRMMVVDVRPGPGLTFGVPRALFREPALITGIRSAGYQPNADGSRFLALLSIGVAGTARPLTVVTNWRKAYGK